MVRAVRVHLAWLTNSRTNLVAPRGEIVWGELGREETVAPHECYCIGEDRPGNGVSGTQASACVKVSLCGL